MSCSGGGVQTTTRPADESEKHPPTLLRRPASPGEECLLLGHRWPGDWEDTQPIERGCPACEQLREDGQQAWRTCIGTSASCILRLKRSPTARQALKDLQVDARA